AWACAAGLLCSCHLSLVTCHSKEERHNDYEKTSTVRFDPGGRADALPCLKPGCTGADRPANLASPVAGGKRSTGGKWRESRTRFPAWPRVQFAVVRDSPR